MGYHNIGTHCLAKLIEWEEKVIALFTHKDNPNENIWFETPEKIAKANAIPVFKPDSLKDKKWEKLIKVLSPDIIFSFYYRNMIPEGILKIPPLGAINLHGSLLPAYRGRSPVNWVLINGEKITGVTMHYMTPKPDDGDIIAQEKVLIDFHDTAFTLFKKIDDAAIRLFTKTFPLIKAGINQRIPQDHSKSSYFGGRTPADGIIKWEWPVIKIYNLIRAVTHPYPGAFTFLRGRKLFIWWALPKQEDKKGKIGEISIEDEKLYINAKDGYLDILSLQFEGEKEMNPLSFMKKYNIVSGEICENK